MPVYEYEPDDRDCMMCNGRIEVIQGVNDPVLRYCPSCGLEVCRVVSRASFRMAKATGAEDAAKKGFTTFKRAEEGKWERLAGDGPDVIEGSVDDIRAAKAERTAPAKKVINLDDPV